MHTMFQPYIQLPAQQLQNIKTFAPGLHQLIINHICQIQNYPQVMSTDVVTTYFMCVEIILHYSYDGY